MSVDIATLSLEIKASSVDAANNSLDRFGRESKNAETAAGKLNQTNGQLSASFGGLAGYIKAAQSALAALGIGLFIKECIDAQLQLERMNRLFTAAAGSANLAGREMEYIRDVVKRYGLDLVGTTESYGKFMAAIRGTSVEGEKGRKIFESVSMAATALGLRADETSGIFNALQQMMSKGKVQMEELRGQLGERLPGAFMMAAKAMGMSTAELDKNLALGNVMADDLLPKLAVELEKTYGKAAVEGAKSAQAEINRFNNSLFESKAAVGEALMPAMNDILSSLRPVIEMVRDAIKAFQQLAVAYAVTFDKIAAAKEVGWFGLMTKSGRSRYQQEAANIDSGGLSQFLEIDKRYSSGAGTGYTAAEQAQQAARAAEAERKRQEAADKATAASNKAAAAAERWRSTYADLQLEIDKLDPTLDEHAQKVAEINNKYDDLAGRFPAHVAALESMRLKAIAAADAYYQITAAIEQNKTELDEYKASQEAMANAEKAHYQGLADTISMIESMQPGAGLDALNAQITKFQEIVEQFPDMAEKASVAIKKLKDDFAESSGLNAILRRNQQLSTSLIDDPYERQKQEVKDRYDQEMKLINERQKLLEKSSKAYADLEEQKTLVTKNSNQAIERIERESLLAKIDYWTDYANAIGGIFGTLANNLMQGNKEEFEMGKKLAYAEAVINIATGVTKAIAQGGIAGIATGAIVAAAGAVQIADIMDTQYEPRAAGGPVLPGQNYLVGEQGPEIIRMGSVGGMVIPNYALSGGMSSTMQLNAANKALDRFTESTDNASLSVKRVADMFNKITGSGASFEYIMPSLPGVGTDAPMTGIIASLGRRISEDISNSMKLDSITGGWFLHSLGTILFGGEKTLAGQGIVLRIDAGTASALGWNQTHTSGGLFGSSKDDYSFSKINVEFTTQVQEVVDKIKDSVSTAAEAMNLEATALEDFNMRVRALNLMGLSASAAQKELEKWLQDVGNAMANAVGPIKDFAKYGENTYDTLIRLAVSLQTVNEKAELFGMALVNSSLENAAAMSKLIEAMGGFDEFADITGQYFKMFYSDAAQQAKEAAQASRQANIAFSDMGLTIPATRDEFARLVESLDLSTSSGQSLFQALMAVAPAFDKVATAAENAARYQDDIIERYARVNGKEGIGGYYAAVVAAEEELQAARDSGYDTTMLEIVQRKELSALLKDQYLSAADNYLDQMTATVDTLRATAERWSALAKQLADMQTNLATGSLSVLQPEDQLSLLKKQLMTTYQSAMKGDITSMGALGGQANSYLEMARKLYASSPAYAGEYQSVMAMLGQAQNEAQNQATQAELQAEQQQRMIDLLQKTFDLQNAEMKKTNEELAAQVRVMQAGFERLIALTENSATSLDELRNIARLEAAA